MNQFYVIVCGLCLFAATSVCHASDFSSQAPLKLTAASPNARSVPCYGTLELTLDLTATFDNPFDSEDVDVYARFTPSKGDAVRVNGFYYQPFTRRLENNAEKIEATGPPVWKIRFSPNVPGAWTYTVFAKDRTGSVQLPQATFEVTPSTASGFIRTATNSAYFAWDDGKPFFAVGENVCWGGRRGVFDYDDWLAELGRAGANFIRIWMSSWNCALEWTRENKGDWRSGEYHNVGVYSLGNAWKLDVILDTAQRHGINVMLCLGTYGELKDGGYFGEGQWKANPYNRINGGPCEKPAELWTDGKARKLYQRRLRYLAARYGHRTNLQSWEFWNEAEAPAAWVAEMARYLKGTGEFQGSPADPYRHLVTTTYGKADVWNIPEIDLTQTHSYGIGDFPDHAPVAHKEALNHAGFRKPHLLAEFGIDWRSPDNKYDAQGKGVNLHHGLWASALSGDAGGAMIWWWDSYVHPKKLYPAFTGLRKFSDTIPWIQGTWKPFKIQSAESNAAATLNIYGLANGTQAAAWIQNAAFQWKNAYENKTVPAVPKTELIALGLAPGRYLLAWWDTWKGEVTREGTAECLDGKLAFTLPPLETDVAVRFTPISPKP